MGVPFRQIAIVLLGLIAVLGAGLFILSFGDDDPADDATDDDGGETTTTTTSTTTTTTTLPAVTTSVPVECGTGDTEAAEEVVEETTTTVADGDEEPPLEPTLDRSSSLSTVGLDEVTFGLTVNEASAASGTPFINCAPVSDCYRVIPEFAPEGISFVVRDGTIERVDIVGDSPITTRSGAGIGTTDDELTALFGDRLERVDLGGGHVDVIFVPQDENDQEFRVAFTTVDGVVETMRSGRVPLVLEASPCA